MRVLLDTSFILWGAEEGLDIGTLLEEALPYPMELATPIQVIRELEAMSGDRSVKRSRTARTALRVAEGTTVIEPSNGDEEGADEAIVSLASGGDFVVATLDSRLRRRLREKSVPVVYFKDNWPQLLGAI